MIQKLSMVACSFLLMFVIAGCKPTTAPQAEPAASETESTTPDGSGTTAPDGSGTTGDAAAPETPAD